MLKGLKINGISSLFFSRFDIIKNYEIEQIETKFFARHFEIKYKF